MILENEIMDIAMTTVSRETPLILSASHGQEEAALQLLTAIPCDMLVRDGGAREGGREGGRGRGKERAREGEGAVLMVEYINIAGV